MDNNQIEKMTIENALSIKQLTEVAKSLTKDVDRVVKAVEDHKEYNSRIIMLENQMDNFNNIKSKFIFSIIASWVGLAGYSIKALFSV